jgi:hypothetical protein
VTISRKSEAKLRRILGEWSRAIVNDIKLHGAPNSFGVTELAREYGMTQADGYRLGSTRLLDLQLWVNVYAELGPKMIISYKNARFIVTGATP